VRVIGRKIRYFKFLHFTIFITYIILLVHTILFTSYTISTSYTNIHYTVFEVYTAHKKSSFLVIRVLFGLLDVLAAFLCKSSAFPFINSVFVSSVEVADGTSFHFKLTCQKILLYCAVISAIFSLPEKSMSCKLISSQIHIYYTYKMHIFRQFMRLPVKNLYLFIYVSLQ
jgi:hypothetical protein